jgi:hypothetical protein
MTEKVHIMQQKRDPLSLGNLPLVSPPADDWPVIEAALRQQSNRKRVIAVAAGALAIAATVILTVGVYVYRPYDGPTVPSASQQTQTAGVESSVPSDESLLTTLDSFIALSQQLESNLRTYRSQSGVMPTSSLVYQVELEDLVAQVDEELSMRPDSVDLWNQRINLLLDLSQIYQNELRREYHRMASM